MIDWKISGAQATPIGSLLLAGILSPRKDGSTDLLTLLTDGNGVVALRQVQGRRQEKSFQLLNSFSDSR